MTQLIFRADRCEWTSLRVGGTTVAEDSATGGVDQVEEEVLTVVEVLTGVVEVLTEVVAEGVDQGTVGRLDTEIEEAGQETVEASVEASRTGPATATLTGAHPEEVPVVPAASTEDHPHLAVIGGLQTARSSGSPQQKSCPTAHG